MTKGTDGGGGDYTADVLNLCSSCVLQNNPFICIKQRNHAGSGVSKYDFVYGSNTVAAFGFRTHMVGQFKIQMAADDEDETY